MRKFFKPGSAKTQPLDIRINNLLKNELKKLWVLNRANEKEVIDRKLISKCVLEAWNRINAEQIRHCFNYAIFQANNAVILPIEQGNAKKMEIEEEKNE